jgi:hydroxymethylpyrimidine pyrophosphatase-like HAD family hydrolase
MIPRHTPPLQLVCTDFDGTIHTDLEAPAIAPEFQAVIAQLQSQGVRWVVNTGRSLADLLRELARARLAVAPDYLVVVEREIHVREGDRYVANS